MHSNNGDLFQYESAVCCFVSLQVSAEVAVMTNDEFFSELIQSIEKTQCAVKNLIKAQKDAVVKEAEELAEKLQQQITDLKERHSKLQHLEQLSREGNNISFLQVNVYVIFAL